jgi:hypothetical protein
LVALSLGVHGEFGGKVNLLRCIWRNYVSLVYLLGHPAGMGLGKEKNYPTLTSNHPIPALKEQDLRSGTDRPIKSGCPDAACASPHALTRPRPEEQCSLPIR